MALKKKENICIFILLIVTEIILPLVATQNIDCKGKAFHCVNSTHFKICVDLGGGVSTTVDDFLIPCPKSTVCKNSNYFECEYSLPTTTLKPTQLSEVTIDHNYSETPAVKKFDFSSTLNGSLISDIELSKVIISTTLIPKISSTTFTNDSDINTKNVTSVISDSAIYNNINSAITEVSSKNLLPTTTEKVILDNNKLNYTEPVNYSSENVQSTDNNITGVTLNTYFASDVTEGYTKVDIENKSTLLSNTFTNHNDKDEYNHTSVKNESFLVISSENISVFKKTTNIQYGVTAIEIEPKSSITKNIGKESSTETVLRSSLYDEVAEQNTITSSQNILSTISEDQFSPANPFQNEISITTNSNINMQYHQGKVFTATQSNIEKENNTTESNLLANSFNKFHENKILPSTEMKTMSKYEPSSTLSPIIQYLSTVKNILNHQNEYMPTKKETQGSFFKERVFPDINDAYIDNLSTPNYESTTEFNSNYETGRIREEQNVYTQNLSETLNYSLSDLQLSTYTTRNTEYISFTGNPLQSTINDEINSLSSLPNTNSESETVIEILNDGAKPINYYNYTTKHDQNIIFTQSESISKTDGTETTETTRDNLQTTTPMTPTEFSNQPTYQLTSTISITKNIIQPLPENITLPAINVLSKMNSTSDATTNYNVDINKDVNTTFVNAENINISAVIDEPVASVTTIINVSDIETTAGFISSEGEKTNTETHMYDSEKMPTAVTLFDGKYPTSTDSNITSNFQIVDTITTTEPYVSTIDASLRIFKNTTFKDREDTNIDKRNKINTIIMKDKHAEHIKVPNITISGGISMQINNNINNQEKVDVNINKTNDVNLLNRSKMNPGEEVTEFYEKNTQNSSKSIIKQNTTTMKVVDANINKDNEKKKLIYNNTETTSEEYISDGKFEYSNNINISNKKNMQIFNITNNIDKKYVTSRTGLVVNDSISKYLNMDFPITEKEITDLNFEKIYKAPNNDKLNGKEIKINTALSAVNGSQANITQMYDSDDGSQVDYTDNVIRTTDNNIPTFDDFKVKDDKSKANAMNMNFINSSGIKMPTHEIILLNEMKLKEDFTEVNISRTEASVSTEIYYYNKTKDVTFIPNNTANDSYIVYIDNKTLPHMVYDVSLNISVDTNVHQNGTIWVKKLKKENITDSNQLKTLLVNNIGIDQSPNVNITIDNEDNIQKNNSIIEINSFKNSTVSDVITESVKISTLNTNINKVKEIKSIADTAIDDFNFTVFNVTKSNDVNLTGTLVDLLNIKSSATSQQIYNDTQMQDMISVSDIRVLNKSEGNTKENNIIKIKGSNVYSTPKDISNNTYPKHIESENIKLEKLLSSQTFRTNNSSKIPHISKSEVSASFYPVIAKDINTNSSEIAKKEPNLRNQLEVLNSKKSFEAVTFTTSEIHVNPEITSDAPLINDFTVPSRSIISNLNDSMQSTLQNLFTKSITLPKLEFKNSYETLNTDNNKLLTNKTVSEVNDDVSSINRMLKTNTSSPSSEIEVIKIIDNVKSIKVDKEVSEDSKYLEIAPDNEKKQSMITNTERSDISKSTYFIQHDDISSLTPFNCTVGFRGKYSDQNDCNKFYICISKLTPIIRRCPGDTVFSEINKQCTKNLSHCIRNNQFKCLAEGRFIDVLSNNSYYICAKNPSKGLVRFKLKCQEGYRLDTDTVHCTLKLWSLEDGSKNTSEKTTKEKLSSESDNSKKSFACESEGLFKFPDDSRKYFHCTKKTKLEFRRKIKKCDSDEVFDKDKQKCVDEDSHEEVNGDESNINGILKTNTSTPSCKIEPIEIIDYVKNIKVNEEASEDNKYFETAPNNEKKQSLITNTEKSALSKSTYFVQHVHISSSTPVTCNKGIRGKYSDKNDCNKFYICIGKLTPIIRRCPGDTVFSEVNKQCTKNLSHCIRNNQFKCLAEGRFIDVLSNNFYYICAKNQSKGLVRFKLKCQEGYRLNTDTVHCTLKAWSIEDDSKNTSEKNTKEKLSSESDYSKKSFDCEKEGLFEFPDDSRKYFHCTKKSKSGFRRKIKKCDSDEVFDKDKQKCVDENSDEGN